MYLDRKRFRAGETIALKVSATETTRTLTARIEGLAPTPLHWSSEARVNQGQYTLPAGLPAGEYQLTVTAEDIAHNLGSTEVSIEVAP